MLLHDVLIHVAPTDRTLGKRTEAVTASLGVAVPGVWGGEVGVSAGVVIAVTAPPPPHRTPPGRARPLRVTTVT
ncbi:unnamed protein product [Danaus chrysippus]|uniref:(African queen) hypothetical protein n=1 Tax=Danaus chrysippus TaxID=151541 RepID=A0A8J2VUY2_9NEOP|nr:unnamed protein product [Danaus chrysippus]